MSVLSDEQLYAAYYSRIENDDQDNILGLRAVADSAIAADRAARAEPVAGWKWMSHPTRRNGEIVPVKVWNDPELGVVYLPFDEDDDNCLRWDLKSPDWVEHAAPADDQVGLTDGEIEDHWWGELDNRSLSAIRRIIAAHEAKRGGAA